MSLKSFKISMGLLLSLLLSSSLVNAKTAYGPGVTSGGDGCKQQVFRSFDILQNLFKTGKIDLASLDVPREEALAILSKVTFQFDKNLQKDGLPVEMLNVFGDNIIIVDEKVCASPQEPLSHFTPLLLHEVVRLMGLDDGPNYHISNRFQSIIFIAIHKELGTAKSFQIDPDTIVDGLAIAWGLDNAEVDFEALFQLSEEEQYQFFQDNNEHLVNYLVSIPLMRPLAEIRSSKTILKPFIFESGGVPHYTGDKMTLIYDYRNNTAIIEGASRNREHLVIEKIFVFGDYRNLTVTSLCDTDCSGVLIKSLFETLDKETQNYISQFPQRMIRVSRGPENSVFAYTANIYLAQKIDRYGDFELLRVDFNIRYNPAKRSFGLDLSKPRRQ
jgi:hypothetical protein